jgi:magnesium chelatase family protein
MAFATVLSRAQLGLSAPLVQVEVHLAPGLPCFNLVGLPAPVVRESRERVRAALGNSGFDFPAGRITVNLAPVDLAKDGGRYDLPIALGVLLASGQAQYRGERVLECYGELGLSGELKAASGLFLAAVQAARDGHLMLLPRANEAEALAAGASEWVPLQSLQEACAWLQGPQQVHEAAAAHQQHIVSQEDQILPFEGITGHTGLKRALVIAAAGAHSLLLQGPPGCGKSLLAGRLPALLPPLAIAEALEVAGLQSLSGGVFEPGEWGRRPFRAPHHSASASAIIGGGPRLLPGEISLAHRGVLFLDELPEFDRRVLESLREPLESGSITLARVNGRQELPADFQFVAAMNPCPCGYLGDEQERCRCTPPAIDRYRARISGPLLDRIDIRVAVMRQATHELMSQPTPADSGNELQGMVPKQQVCAARRRQLARAGCLNARLPPARLAGDCRVDPGSRALLERSQQTLRLTGRGLHRLLRLARTIADLGGAADIDASHLAEAIQLRRDI